MLQAQPRFAERDQQAHAYRIVAHSILVAD
jgi:hypothetical protein